MQLVFNMKLSLFTLFVILSTVYSEDEIPSYIKRCKRGDDDLNKCLLENFAKIRPRLSEGIPELFIPSLDSTFPAPDLKFTNDTFSVELTNIKWTRQDMDILEFDLDLDKGTFNILAVLKSLDYESDYKISGTWKGVTFEPTEGYEYGGSVNATMWIKLKGKKTDDGKHMEFKKEGTELLSWEGGHFNFTHSDPERVRELNQVTNDYYLEFCSSMHIQFDRMTGTIVEGVVRDVFLHYTLDDLFPK